MLFRSCNLSKLGFDFESDTLQEYLKVQSLLVSRYHIQNGSMITIMKEFQIPSSRTMDILFREFDITARSTRDAATLSVQEGRSTPLENLHTFVHIWHSTWDGKSFLLRSSLEEKLAKLLDAEKVCYEVECLRVKYFDEQNITFRTAAPDFYIPQDNRIIEVKSAYWLDEQNMRAKVDAYRKLGYSFSLYLDGVMIEDW